MAARDLAPWKAGMREGPILGCAQADPGHPERMRAMVAG